MNLPWLAHSRPSSGTITVFGQACARCGRGLYIVPTPTSWGKAFCRGCDESQHECWCPDSREVLEVA